MIGLTSVIVMIAVKNKPDPEIDTQTISLQTIEVQAVSVADYAPIIQSQGTVTARYSGNLVTQVEGQVLEVSKKLLAGNVFEQGEVLVKLDPARYLTNQATAKSDLATRERDLIEEQLQSKQAKADWKRAGINDQKPSALTLREPQLKSAQAQVTAAKAVLALASKDLKHTEVTAPYNGSVISHQVSPGDYVQIGQTLAEIYANDALELALPLSQAQISLLGHRNAINPSQITISSTEDEQRQWTIRSWRLARAIDQANRWQQLIVELQTDSENAPLPGEFLQAEIEGPLKSNLIELDQLSLARNGSIWYVNAERQLAFYHAPVVFRFENKIYVKPPDNVTQLNIVRYPQDDFLAGTKVEPVFGNGLSLQEQVPVNKTL